MRVLVHKGLTAIFLTALTLFLCGGELPAAEMWLTGNSARPISMGRAYTAAQNDIGTLFYNPAGISEAVSFEMSSLSTKLGGDFSYSSFDSHTFAEGCYRARCNVGKFSGFL